jgi:hypothetical protein
MKTSMRTTAASLGLPKQQALARNLVIVPASDILLSLRSVRGLAQMPETDSLDGCPTWPSLAEFGSV